ECPLNDCIATSSCQNSLCVYNFQPASTVCDDGNVCNGDDECDGGGRCFSINIPAPFNTSCDNGVWCDGEDICDGDGACINEQHPTARCDSNSECDNQCNEVEHNCFSDPGTLCSQ